MSDKFLCLMATFDEATAEHMKVIGHQLQGAGFSGNQRKGLPYHITLATYEVDQEDLLINHLTALSKETPCIELDINHIGLFGLEVLFLAPDVTSDLLDLHVSVSQNSKVSDRGWTPHATLLIDEQANITKALPLVAEAFKPMKAKITGLSLYEFSPARHIASYLLMKS